MTKAEYARRRIRYFESAVLNGLPIGRTLPPCGTDDRVDMHRRRGETCGLCRLIGERSGLEQKWKTAEERSAADALRPLLRRATRRKYEAKEEVRRRKVEWRRTHPEQVAASSRRYTERLRATDPERLLAERRARKALRRARLKGVPAEPIDRRVVWLRDGGICHICTLPADPARWHLDHVIPVAVGGPHLYDNVRVSHPLCNQRKGAKTA